MWATRLLLALKPDLDTPISLDLGLDWRVLGFTLLVSLATGIVFGLSPALQSSRPDVWAALKSDTPGGGSHRSRARNAFVVAQIALSLVLLVGAGLFLRSLQNASKIDPGFNPDGVQTVGFNLRIQGYDEARGREFYRQLVERVEAIAGVRGVSLARMVPLIGNNMAQGITIKGQEPPPGSDSFTVGFNVVDSRYFQTLEVPLLAGRSFTEADRKGAPRVAVVNEAFARRFFPDADAIGRQFSDGGVKGEQIEIIGIVKDGKYVTFGEDTTPYFYLPYQQNYSAVMTLHIRSASGDIAGVLAGVRNEARALDKDLPLVSIMPMIDMIGFSLIPLRVAASVVGVLGILGLVLASVGIFGIVNYSVAQRTREIGIRMALGARSGDVLGMVIKQGMRLALTGVGIGLAGAFAMTRALTSLLYGVSASDPAVFALTAALLAAVALMASYIPARRATRVDPMIALRYE
jgi:predicted permease